MANASKQALCVVDGDHQTAATLDAIEVAKERGYKLVALVWAGGSEKARPDELATKLELPLFKSEQGPMFALKEALAAISVDFVLDFSDDPALTAKTRSDLTSFALSRGVAWVTADSEVRPPQMFPAPNKPTIAVYATGKRTGKTATAQALALYAGDKGFSPVIVAMGRGGPPEPIVIEASAAPTIDELVAISESGGHAASDYIEDAVVTGCTTIGCRRVGGGLAGTVWTSTVERGLEIAQERPEDLVIVEGSGSAIPPVEAHARLLVVGADGLKRITTGFGPTWVHLADAALVLDKSDGVDEHLRSWPNLKVATADLVVRPLSDVTGRKAIYATTAAPQFLEELSAGLTKNYGAQVVGATSALSEPDRLRAELDNLPLAEVLIIELKGAAISVAVDWARARNMEVVLTANEPVSPHLEALFDSVLDRARSLVSSRK